MSELFFGKEFTTFRSFISAHFLLVNFFGDKEN